MARPVAFSFRAKLLASYAMLVVAVVAVAVVELDRSLARDLRSQLDQRLEQQVTGAAQWGVGEGRRHPEKIAARLSKVLGTEVTIFDEKGAPIGDSRPDPVGAGDVGPEVSAALGGAVGRASRRSTLSGVENYYVAVRATDGWVLRLSVPLSDIERTVTGLRSQLLFAAALALVAALGLGLFASRVIASPLRAMTASARRIADGDFDIRLEAGTPDEFGVLAASLTSLAVQLKARIGELVAERDRLFAILAGMAEGVIVADNDGRIVLANPAAARILGARGSLEKSVLAEALAEEAMRVFVRDRVADGATAEREFEGADGRSTAVYVTTLEGRAGVVCVFRDMTGIRRVMTMRRDFMANASHELRTPVAAIQGYTETLLGGAVGEADRRAFLETIERHANRLARLVDDVLRLSELEDRPSGASRKPVVLSDVASFVVETVRAKAERAEMQVAADVDGALVVLGDATGLEQVLENLVDNAIKYGRRGGQVRIVGRAAAERVELRVIDDGPGIDVRHLPRIFERFYRVDASRSRERGGSGLGLAIVKQLVESMGGAVRAESEVGKGSTFVLTFDAAPSGAPSRDP